MYKTYEKLRDERGMTNYQVAKETGIGENTLSQWKSGRSIPKADKLLKIAKLFKVPMETLLEEQEV